MIQCNIRDITDRKKAEQRLNLLDTCLSNLNDIVLVTESNPIDAPGPKIVFVNAAFERLTGYTSAETLGRSPRFLQGEKTDRGVLAEIRQALAQQQPIRRQVINYKKDGTEYWMDIDIVPIFDLRACAPTLPPSNATSRRRKKTRRGSAFWSIPMSRECSSGTGMAALPVPTMLSCALCITLARTWRLVA